MGFFGAGKEKIDISHIMVTTTENIPGKKYEIIGPVGILEPIPLKHKAMDEIKTNAAEMGADAIVTFRILFHHVERTENFYFCYGTAVRFID
ncbi:heavy metal-binding domain-containing protein [Candidatus Formimonas warabiya]|uniref:Heavy metal-binding domain-containing protein n=1 Tax=Formimonas warabiya TaxID=1761012 RepID=A0A3G1KWI7_FORW1|nr:heavy metal-binding domain-containing protein [Candidatus Formimonas warabiya]ATW26801.1 hypothetical protein DCMF_20330 [Candidatus Formimonas warabiya]